MYGLGPSHPPSPPDTLRSMYPNKSFGSLRNGLPYTHHSRESSRTSDRERGRSRWLVVVKSDDGIADVLARSGLSEATGVLVMLQQTMTLQLLSLLSHFSLPSPSGLSLRISLPDDSTVRITEEAWPALFAHHLAMEPAVLPIAATLTLCVDQNHARWFKSWAMNPRAGIEGSIAGVRVSERLALQEIRTELSQPIAQAPSTDAYAKIAEWQQNSTPLNVTPPPEGLTEGIPVVESERDTTPSPYNPADYTYSISSLGPPSPLPSAPLSYKHFTPLTPDIGRRNEGSVCLTPSTATTWGPTTGDWGAASPSRLSSVDLGERAASPGDVSRGEGRGPWWWAADVGHPRDDVLGTRYERLTEDIQDLPSKQNQGDPQTPILAGLALIERPSDADIPSQARLHRYASSPCRASISSRRKGSPPLEIMVPVLRQVAAIQVSEPGLTAPAPSAHFETIDLSSGRPGAALCPVDVCDSWTGSHKSKGWASDTIQITAGSDILVSEDAMDIEPPLASSSALHTLGAQFRESAPSPEATGISNPFDFPLTPDSSRRRASISSTVSSGVESFAPKRPVKTVLRVVGNFSEGVELGKPLNSPLLRKTSTQSLGYPHIEIYPVAKKPRGITPFYCYPHLVVYAPVTSSAETSIPKPIPCLLGPPLPWPRLEVYPPLRRDADDSNGTQPTPAANLSVGETVTVLIAPPLPWPPLVLYPAVDPWSISVTLPGSRAYPWLEIYPETVKPSPRQLSVTLPGSTAYPRFDLYPRVYTRQPLLLQVTLPGSSAYPNLVIYPHHTLTIRDEAQARVEVAHPIPVKVNLATPLPYPDFETYPASQHAAATLQRSPSPEEPGSIPPLQSTPLSSRPPPFSSSPISTDSDEESCTRPAPVRDSVIGLSIRGRFAASPQPRAASGSAAAPGARSRSGTLISERAAFFSRPESTGSPPKTTGRLDKATLGRWV